MKFVLIFLVVLVIAWRWRAWRAGNERVPGAESKESLSVKDTVSCRQCGLHVVKNEAVVGRSGTYCSDVHRRQMEA